MSGSPLIIKPAAPASPVGSVMTLDGWWPDIDYTSMREALRIGETVTQPRLVLALQTAVSTVTGDLRDWKRARQRQGVTSLAAVDPDDIIDGQPRLVSLFIGAIYYAAAASLADLSTDFSATASDETRADAKRDLACTYERLRLNNVRDILNTTRIAVELI